MSETGVFAGVIFILSFIAFLLLMVIYDVYRNRKYGPDGTITYGIRYLIRHVPLLMITLAFLFGMTIGGLLVHFAGAPFLWW